MVATETLKTAFIFKSLGGKCEHLNFSFTLPANSTVTVIYTPPEGYFWVKEDSILDYVGERDIKVTLRVDNLFEFYEDDIDHRFADETWRCGVGSFIFERMEMKVTNNTSKTITVGGIARGILLKKEDLPKVIETLTTTKLSESDVKLLEEIRDCLKEVCEVLKSLRRV